MLDIIKIAPVKSSDEKYSKTSRELKCPFCGSPFEAAELDVSNRKARCTRSPEDKQGYYVHQMKERIPLVLRCTECEVEIRNIQLIGLYTRIENYKTSLEQRDSEQ